MSIFLKKVPTNPRLPYIMCKKNNQYRVKVPIVIL